VSASVDVGRLVDDVSSLEAKVPSGAANPFSGDDKSELVHSIKDAKVDLYVGAADHILRKFAFRAVIEGNDGRGDLNVELTTGDLNKPQRISTPASARPFTQLEGDLRTGGLEALAGGGSAPAPPAPAATNPGTSSVPSEAQGYLSCVRKAASASGLQRCASLLP
jgi:hypothetical protein